MKIKELIEKLVKFHPESNISIIANNKEEKFSLSWGGGYDGLEDLYHPSINVHLYVDRLNTNEQ